MKKSNKKLILRESKNNTLLQPEPLEEDIYSKENLETYIEEDLISSEEQAFMLGYLAS